MRKQAGQEKLRKTEMVNMADLRQKPESLKPLLNCSYDEAYHNTVKYIQPMDARYRMQRMNRR